MTAWRQISELTLKVCMALAVGVMSAAVSVRALGPDGARKLLGFRFEGVDESAAEVAGIFLNNARVLVVVVGAGALCALAQARSKESAFWGGFAALIARALDVVVLGLAALNAVVVGAGLGAYGERMVGALLPHGPFEYAAFGVAGGLYIALRRGVAPARAILVWTSAALALLLVGACAEVFVQ